MKIRLSLLLICTFLYVSAQQTVSLENLNDFENQAGNWFVVGDVTMDRNIDVHPKEKVDEKTKRKKRKKNKKVEPPKAVVFEDGTGILLNINNESQKDALFTKWEHGDIKLELEVMLPKGSNSGIYLQGRYELQLLDSWGVMDPKFSDIGGIYRNWEKDPDKIFRGVAPSTNAAKAPGLWQKLSIHFQAPRFNNIGEKIANAKFVSVILNGVQIHNNVEVPLYTGGQISKKEASKGPLMIQGDHGPVAFRNIMYQLLEDPKFELTSLQYQIYKGAFKGLEELKGKTVVTEGYSDQIDIKHTGEEDNYGIEYKGTLQIDKEDSYTFIVGYTGGINLVIDNETVFTENSGEGIGELEQTITLSKGAHSIELTNIKSAGWRAPRLGLIVSSSSTNPKTLNSYDSNPSKVSTTSPIFVQAGSKPRLLRGFVGFGGDGERLSHTIGIGTPEGVNYIYDLGSANLIGVWRGEFIDATPMWHNRGDGSFKPRGAVQWTFLNQQIAELKNFSDPFPKSGEAPDFIPKGYSIDALDGLPVFRHEYKGVSIENRIISNGIFLIHEVKFSKTGLANWYQKVASGMIRKMPDGSYAINDQQYYIRILSGQNPVIRKVNGETELVIPVNGSTIKYELIW